METILIYERKRVLTKTGKSRFVWTCNHNGQTLTAPTRKALRAKIYLFN
jgi:hypothetical protein